MTGRSESYSLDKETMVESDSSNNTPNKVLLVAIVVVAIVALVALIVAAFSFTRQPMTTINVDSGNDGATLQDGGQPDTEFGERVWTFAIGHDGTSLEYINEEGGLRGFHVDIVNAVCEVANKNCRLVFDIYQNCWDSEAGHWPRAGTGLMSRWYDACTGWFATYERLRSVDFTDEFREGLGAAFYVKNGNPNNFDWNNILNKTIAVLDGWAADEYCIKRNSDKIQNVGLGGQQITHYVSRDAILEAVNSGEVDAAFVNVNMFTQNEVQKVSDELTCVKGGGSMMMRKDSTLASWWNPAFARLKETNQYRQICDTVANDHGHMPGTVTCVD